MVALTRPVNLKAYVSAALEQEEKSTGTSTVGPGVMATESVSCEVCSNIRYLPPVWYTCSLQV